MTFTAILGLQPLASAVLEHISLAQHMFHPLQHSRTQTRAFLRLTVLIALAVASRAIDAEEQSPPAFTPGEISIGEPIQLPPRAAPQPAARAGSPLPEVSGTAAVPGIGTGWLGLTADDSLVPGRLVVVDVAEAGPAAQAGIQPQDQLLGINGKPLRSSDQLAAELAAIAPGNDVKLAVGRSDRIDEVLLKAMERPARTPSQPLPPDRASAPAVAATAPVATAAPSPLPPAQLPATPITDGFGPATVAAPQAVPSAPAAPVFAAAPAAAPVFAAAPAAAAALASTPRPAPPAPLASDLPERPAAQQPAAQQPAALGRTALGVRTLPVDPSVQARFRLSEPAGALVIGVVQDLPASKAGVPPGSVIVALDNQPVRSPNELTKLVTSSPAGRLVSLQYILPGGEQRRAEVSLQSLEVPLERALVGPDR